MATPMTRLQLEETIRCTVIADFTGGDGEYIRRQRAKVMYEIDAYVNARLAKVAAALHEKADRHERQADGIGSPILAGQLIAKAETARYAARLAAGVKCGKDAD